MSLEEKNQLANQVLNLSRFFEIDFSIKVFGHTVFKFHYPPESKK